MDVDAPPDGHESIGTCGTGGPEHGAEIAWLLDVLRDENQARSGERETLDPCVALLEDTDDVLGSTTVGRPIEGGGSHRDGVADGRRVAVAGHERDLRMEAGIDGSSIQTLALDHEYAVVITLTPVPKTYQPLDALVRRRCYVGGHRGEYRIVARRLDPMDLVELGTYNTITEANLVKARLESEGVGAVVQSDDVGSTTPTLSMVRGVLVLVREADRSRAIEILEEAPAGDV